MNILFASITIFKITGNIFLKSHFKHKQSLICEINFKQFQYYSQQKQPLKQNANRDFVLFEKVINSRRDEAKRSILVQVNSEQSYVELDSYCSQYGNIKGLHHYTIPTGNLNLILVEFTKESEVNNILKDSNYLKDTGIPVQSQFLWFRAVKKKNVTNKAKNNNNGPAELLCVDGKKALNPVEVNELLLNANSVSDQIRILYEATRLNDIEIRLRFLAARQVEAALAGLFPNAIVRPFGSSVNGFGKMGCDLDLVLRLDSDVDKPNNSRLVFHTKTSSINGRSQTQRHMEVIGDVLQLFSPGCAQVKRILQARVPIIKYHQELIGLECDLSMSNLTGVYMSELLYILGCMDVRVRPLVFTIRRWAQFVGLTNPTPGRWISNFSLSLLVIFFLQQNNTTPILPLVSQLIQNAKPEDFRVTEDEVNCTFLRDVTQLKKWAPSNIDSLSALLINFFEFYSTYDFANYAISVNQGLPISKPDHSALYIVNPLEPQLNVSKNVSFEETQRFKVEVRNAAWVLESSLNKKECFPWGILNLFNTTQLSLKAPIILNNNRPRMMELKELFDDQDQSENIEYKNETIKATVQAIQQETKSEIRKLKAT